MLAALSPDPVGDAARQRDEGGDAALPVLFLFLHVFGAILAFGPTFAYSIGGAMAGREPQHANFNGRVGAATGSKLVYPLAILQGVTGLALILISGREHLLPTPGSWSRSCCISAPSPSR